MGNDSLVIMYGLMILAVIHQVAIESLKAAAITVPLGLQVMGVIWSILVIVAVVVFIIELFRK